MSPRLLARMMRVPAAVGLLVVGVAALALDRPVTARLVLLAAIGLLAWVVRDLRR